MKVDFVLEYQTAIRMDPEEIPEEDSLVTWDYYRQYIMIVFHIFIIKIASNVNTYSRLLG